MTAVIPGRVAAYLEELATKGDDRVATISGMYSRAHELVPDAVEGESYGMPALLYRERGLLSVLTTARHIGIYPYSTSAIDAIRDELNIAGIPTTRGAIQLPNDFPVDDDLYEKLISTRVAEIDAKLG